MPEIKKVVIVDSSEADSNQTFDEKIALYSPDGNPFEFPSVEIPDEETGIIWHSPSTVIEWKTLVADAIANNRSLHIAAGNHQMPFVGQTSGTNELGRQITINGNLEIIGQGKELTTISPTQDADETRCDFIMFMVAPGGNLLISDLSIQAPSITDQRNQEETLDFHTTIINCKDYGANDTTIKLDRVRILGDETHWFDIGFTSGAGAGLARQRFLVDDCEFGYSSLTISMYGPNDNNREIVLSNSSIGPSGGPGGDYEGFSGHTIYVHPNIVVRADNCHFLEGQRYTLHYFSSGGRTPTNIPSVFTACVFEYSPDFLTVDDGGDSGNRINFTSCTFNTGSHHALGTIKYTDCAFFAGVIYGGPILSGISHPVRIYGCRFWPTIAAGSGIGSGEDIKVYNSEFTNFAYVQPQQETVEVWEFHACSFHGTRFYLSNTAEGSSVALYNCLVDTSTNTYGKNLFQVFVADAVVKLENTTIDTGGSESILDGAGGTTATLSGWGNTIIPDGTVIDGPGGIETNAESFGTVGINPNTPVRNTDLIPKLYVDSSIATATALPTVRTSTDEITDLINADAGNILAVDYSGDAFVKIPTGLTVSTEKPIIIRQVGSGTVTVISDTETIYCLDDNNGLTGQWTDAKLTRLNSTDWILTGLLIEGQPAPTFDPFSVAWNFATWASDPDWSNPGDGSPVASARNGGSVGGVLTASGGARPTFRNSVASLNNQAAFEFNGTSNILSQSGITTTPTTTLVWIGQWKASGGGNLDRLIDINSPNLSALCMYFGSYWTMYSGGSSYDNAANTSAAAVRALFKSGTNNSKLKVMNRTEISATLQDATGGTAFILGGDPTLSSSNFANVYTAFAGGFDGDINTDPNWTLFKSWALSFYNVVIG